MINLFNIKILWVLLATFLVSISSLVGAVSLLFSKEKFQKIIYFLVAFAAGVLLGGSFLHIIPESLEGENAFSILLLVVLGFVLFFLVERYLWWHHCHEGECKVHPFSYLILWGDALHNFIDGLIIGTSFYIDIKVGILATLLILAHEIPQELSDFAVLIFGGFSPPKALFYNFLSQLSSIVGGILGFWGAINFDFSHFVLPIAAGGFIYIAASDLIPEIHEQQNQKTSFPLFILFLAGLLLMILFKYLGR